MLLVLLEDNVNNSSDIRDRNSGNRNKQTKTGKMTHLSDTNIDLAAYIFVIYIRKYSSQVV